MANIIIIAGPMAVGKMTVAEALKEKIGYRLMTNHDSIEISDKIFGFATPPQKEFSELIRATAFNTAAKYNESMIFTLVVDFYDESEHEYIKRIKEKFEATGGSLYFVELSASQDVRLSRNITSNRLEKKKSKQDIEWSNNNLITGDMKYKLNSSNDEFWFDNHYKINNENLEPEKVAEMIIKKYDLKSEEKGVGLSKGYTNLEEMWRDLDKED